MRLVDAISAAIYNSSMGIAAAIRREKYPDYVFYYYPEYGEYMMRPAWDRVCWRSGVGTFREMLIPESWVKEDDWEAVT